MKNPLDDYNLDFDDYPNWKRGFVFGFVGALASTLCICIPLFFASARIKGDSPAIFAFGVFIFSFIVFGAYGAFRPPKKD